MCYTRFGAYPNQMHINNNCKKNLLKKEKKGKEKIRKEKHNGTDRD
jgi:hypothetical protein